MSSRATGGPHRAVRATSAIVAALLVMAVTACGSSSTSTSSSTTSASNTSSATTSSTNASSGDAVADAKRIVDLARKGLVYAPVDSDNPAKEIVAQTSWLGPDSAPKPEPGAKVEVIFCAPGTACETVADGAKEAGEALGWDVELIPGAGTADSFNTAFDTAFSRNPDAIIGVAIPGQVVGDKLAMAKQKGIVTVSAPDVPTKQNDLWDGYVSYRQPLQYQLAAHAIIADSGGTGDAIVVNQSDQPDLVEATKQFQRVMDTCEKCKTSVLSWTIPDGMDPTRADAKITGALAANPKATYLVLPDDIGLPAVIEAVRKSGRDMKIVVKDASKIELESLRNGDLWGVTGAGLDWMGYAAINQVNLGLHDEPYLNPFDQGLGVHLYTQADAPADAVANYDGWLDWRSGYQKLWGTQ